MRHASSGLDVGVGGCVAAEVRSTLKSRRDKFAEDDTAREAAFAAATDALSQAATESQLDERLTSALAKLDDIEAGYRYRLGA